MLDSRKSHTWTLDFQSYVFFCNASQGLPSVLPCNHILSKHNECLRACFVCAVKSDLYRLYWSHSHRNDKFSSYNAFSGHFWTNPKFLKDRNSYKFEEHIQNVEKCKLSWKRLQVSGRSQTSRLIGHTGQNLNASIVQIRTKLFNKNDLSLDQYSPTCLYIFCPSSGCY